MSDELTYGEVWDNLSKMDVSEYTEEKMKLTYLSWSRMWMLLMSQYPQAQYEFVEFDGVPFKTLPDGSTEVATKITIDNLVREMRLPVMDYKNNPVVNPHARQVSDNAMRCLVKNVAMFGLGISVFAGMSDDTLPDAEKDKQPKGKKEAKPKAELEPETVIDRAAEQDKDEAWAKVFVEGTTKVIQAFKTREDVVDMYKANSESIGILKDKFPDYKNLLDANIQNHVNKLPPKEDE